MPTSPVERSNGSEELHGFTKRASRIISNAALYDLVQDMAATLDKELPAIHEALKLILLKLGD